MGHRGVLVAAGLALSTLLAASLSAAATSLPKPGSSTEVSALVKASTSIEKLSAKVSAALPDASNDNPAAWYPSTSSGCTTLTSCVFGDTKSDKTVVVMGDSHAQMWLPALNRIGATKHLKVVLLYLAACPAATLFVWLPAYNEPYTECNQMRSRWIGDIDALKPMAVILSDRTSGVTTAASDGTVVFTSSQWQSGMETTLADLASSGSKLVILGDIVVMNDAPPSCLASNPQAVQSCAVPNPNPVNPGLQSAEESAAAADHARYVNPIPWLCTPKACSEVIGSFIAYSDRYHISCEYAAYLSGVLQTALKKVL